MNLNEAKEIAARVGKPREYGHFINGEWVEGGSGASIALQNPDRKSVV